jgi:hypothetical protein
MSTVIILLKDKAFTLNLGVVAICFHDRQHLLNVQRLRYITRLILVEAVKDQIALKIPPNAGLNMKFAGADFELLLNCV